MINLRLRTEYSFGTAYGPLPRVIAAVGDAPALGIADRSGTWGHVQFEKACKRANKKPIFGAEIGIVPNLDREEHAPAWMAFMARNNAGLREVYELVTESTGPDNFYYFPRLPYSRLSGVSENVIILTGFNPKCELLPKRQKNIYVDRSPSTLPCVLEWARDYRVPFVAASDNYYPRPEDNSVYQIVAGRRRDARTTPMHILDEWEWAMHCPGKIAWDAKSALAITYDLAKECNATIPKAKMVTFPYKKSLEQLCREAAPKRGINLKDPVYSARLRREIDLIADKEFEDYFYVIWDMLLFAKGRMLVGPARGSSCGSLVCYLLSITEIDPIPFGLIFERFIDINRKDLPDIDIDFPDDRREQVFEYIAHKYGKDCVARLGTVMRYQAKSAIDAVAISLRIPIADTETLKSSILERSGGDARAAFCILDTFNELEIGREMLRKYPHLKIAAEIEAHASTSGQHAAGVVITAEPISQFCSVNQRNGVAMVDKKDAEEVNFLKIDALGLRTLSVIQDSLDQIGQTREWITKYPLDDAAAFEVINNSRFAGVFQFDGYAVQSLCQQMKIDNFEDIAALGALARPGPLNSGGANEYIKRRTGQTKTTYLHPLVEPMTRVSYGIVIYQEQVMEIARIMGKLSWEDVSSLRKAMSKSLGDEFFNTFWVRFLEGALSQGVTKEDARHVWENINTMGSWSFNRSHSVAYGMVSYWCMVLKAHFPLQWAAACLRNARSEDQCIKLLRELDGEGFKYRDFDYDYSGANWTIRNNELLGGITNIKGIGPKIAEQILAARKEGRALSDARERKLRAGLTPFSPELVFECRTRFGHIMSDPRAFNIGSKIWRLSEITSDMEGDFLFFGKVVKKDVRDLNEPLFVQKRGGVLMEGQTQYLNLTVEDDTSSILLSISKHKYLDLGKPIVESGKIGDWYLWKGWMYRGFRKVYVKRIRTEAQFTRRLE